LPAPDPLIATFFMRIIPVTTGTRKSSGSEYCEFTIIENCQVEIQNHSDVAVKISIKELKGTEATTHYGILTINCVVGTTTLTAASPGGIGGTCTDTVKSLLVPGAWPLNFLTVTARDTPFTGSTTAEALRVVY
jgi:hypothetical protein